MQVSSSPQSSNFPTQGDPARQYPPTRYYARTHTGAARPADLTTWVMQQDALDLLALYGKDRLSVDAGEKRALERIYRAKTYTVWLVF